MGLTRESGGSDDTGTSTGIPKPSCSPSASESVNNGFADFWKQYPKKVSKQDALKAWNKLKPSGQLLADLMECLGRQIGSEQWQRDGGQFIPYPASWIKWRRWEDVTELPTITDSKQADPKVGDVRNRGGRDEVLTENMGWVPA